MVIAVTPRVLTSPALSRADKQICRDRVYERAVSNFSIFFPPLFPLSLFFYFSFSTLRRGKCITQNYGAITRYAGR